MTAIKFKLTIIILIVLLKSFSNITSAQNIEYFSLAEDTLNIIASEIPALQYDFERLSKNEQFKQLFLEALQKEGSMEYPFDSLNNVSLLSAPDNSFRIITWYIPLMDGKFEYFGFFQVMDEHSGNMLVYVLSDRTKASEDMEYMQLSHEDWHGTYYYQLIHNRYKREDYYTLLGWRGDNNLTRKRIIEPIRLGGYGRPVFGIPQFTFDNNRYKRIIFEYSANVSMHLNYEQHYIEGKRRPINMIVFDRLEPSHPRLKGHYQFYFPETNILDAFVFEDGRWVFIEEIDARNPENSD